MPSVSKAQQKFMGMVHSTQKGDMKNPSKEVQKVADSMSDTDAKDFASTKHSELPDKIKEFIIREARGIKTIHKEYADVVEQIQKHLELYKQTKGTPEEKKHIQHLKQLNDKKKALADELDKKVTNMYVDAELKVDEMSTTANVAGYNTPYAFSSKDDENKKNKKIASLMGYTVVKEVTTNDWHYKAIMAIWDKGGSFTRKKIGTILLKDPQANRRDIENALRTSGYDEVTDVTDRLRIEGVNEDKVYIDYLNKKKGFKQDRIKFNSYEEAVKWARKNFEKFNPDMIKYESVKESTDASNIIKDLDKVKNDLIKKVDVLIAKKKKLYADVDIESPMSADEKQLEKDIQNIFSQIQSLIQQKRKIKS